MPRDVASQKPPSGSGSRSSSTPESARIRRNEISRPSPRRMEIVKASCHRTG